MTQQTSDYISLKPISDRFKEVASSITDDEIRSIIKDELRRQIREQVEFGFTIQEWIDLWLEDTDNADFVMKCLRNCIEEKFKK